MGRTCGEPNEIKKNTHPKCMTALFRAAGPETLHPFEFAVLEVKLSGEAPLWVDDLLAKDWPVTQTP